MNRRELIGLVGGATLWPIAAIGQQGERLKRVGVLMNLAHDDPETVDRHAALLDELGKLGWVSGKTVHIEYRYAAGDNQRLPALARELVAIDPDVIVANATPSASALKQVTRTIPIVFAAVIDPVGAGLVDTLARPGGNATGFTSHEFGLSAKWLELIKQIEPGVRRVGVIRDAASPTGIGHFGAIQSVAPSFNTEAIPIGVADAGEIERGVASLAQGRDRGLVVTPSTSAIARRDLIIELAARYRIPAVYPHLVFCRSGGLVSYGVDRVDQYRRAAAYVDRLLKGDKPSELPVQASSKYALAVNIRTARTLNFDMPPLLVSTADEVIE
jgi:putative ABC transport system substrate-binding protein